MGDQGLLFSCVDSGKQKTVLARPQRLCFPPPCPSAQNSCLLRQLGKGSEYVVPTSACGSSRLLPHGTARAFSHHFWCLLSPPVHNIHEHLSLFLWTEVTLHMRFCSLLFHGMWYFSHISPLFLRHGYGWSSRGPGHFIGPPSKWLCRFTVP